MKLLSVAVLVAAVFGAQAPAVLAAEGLPGATVRSDGGPSASERRARMEAFCKAEPEKCREMQTRMQERREACKADPEKCRAERKARFEQWCKANPEKCREMQARREQCKADPEKCRAEMQAQREQRFKRADANGDGRLTRAEAEKGMPAVARNFDRIDANQDGVVTINELEAARKARAGARKGPGGSLRPGAIVPA